MNYLAFVGPALRFLNKGVAKLASKSDDNPKTSATLAVMGGLATWFNVDPASLAAIGKALVNIGTLLQSIAGGP